MISQNSKHIFIVILEKVRVFGFRFLDLLIELSNPFIMHSLLLLIGAEVGLEILPKCIELVLILDPKP